MASDDANAPAPETSTNSRGMFRFLLWPVAILALYLLSVGPVAKYYKNRKVPTIVLAVYSPVEALYDQSPVFEAGIEAYLKLWGVRDE